MSQLRPALEKRTYELLQCMERRQANSMDGTIDLSECFCHWAYDFMVSYLSCHCLQRRYNFMVPQGDMIFGGTTGFELMKNGDPMGLIAIGKRALWALDRLGFFTSLNQMKSDSNTAQAKLHG
jgi:hypothetical protein